MVKKNQHHKHVVATVGQKVEILLKSVTNTTLPYHRLQKMAMENHGIFISAGLDPNDTMKCLKKKNCNFSVVDDVLMISIPVTSLLFSQKKGMMT